MNAFREYSYWQVTGGMFFGYGLAVNWNLGFVEREARFVASLLLLVTSVACWWAAWTVKKKIASPSSA